MKPSVAFTVLVFGVLRSQQVLLADSLTYATIDVPGAIGMTAPHGINNLGQIVGSFIDASGTQHGFLDINGIFSRIDGPGNPFSTSANGINNLGKIVGSFAATPPSMTLPPSDHGFLDINGTFTIIDVPGSDPGTTIANGVNDLDQIVGTDSVVTRGFLDSSGVFTSIFPGMNLTFVYGINNVGQIVGYNPVGGVPGQTGFVEHNGVFTGVSAPNGFQTIPRAINNRGQIVGIYFAGGGQVHSFLESNGVFTTIDFPGALGDTIPHGINDSGEIVGAYSTTPNSNFSATHGFLAVPVPTPEPTSLLLFASGLAGVLTLLVRKRLTSTSS